jgi:hypothetical protein
MKKILFCIADYKDHRQEIFDNNYSPKNKAYADKWGYEYRVYKSVDVFRGNPTWSKFTVLQDMIANELSEGDIAVNLDADMVIVDDSEDFYQGKSWTYAIDNGNTHCMGNYGIKINEWSTNMIERLMSDDRYEKYKDHPFWLEFREQCSWYFLAGIQRHSWTPFNELPNNGFHSELWDADHYSLEELNEHVDIKGPEWNTTLLAEEAKTPQEKMLQQYNIVRSLKEDTKIRHWAGGQTWRTDGVYK